MCHNFTEFYCNNCKGGHIDFCRIKGRVPEDAKYGGTTVLTEGEENRLSKYIIQLGEIGCPWTDKDLGNAVKSILDADGRQNPFKNNYPGRSWFDGFFARHPEISHRKGQGVHKAGAGVTKEMLHNWFDGFAKYITENTEEGMSILNDPRRLSNADETGCRLKGDTGRVQPFLVKRGQKQVYVTQSGDKQQITVVGCFCADGEYMPPFMVFPGVRLTGINFEDFPEAYRTTSENGWMTQETWLLFMEKYNEWMTSRGIKKPFIMWIDGHSSHISLEIAEYCNDSKIILYCFVANSTRFQQPADVALYSPFKVNLQDVIREYQFTHIGEVVTKHIFPKIFKEVWVRSAKRETAINGFRATGLYPFNKDAIHYDRLVKSADEVSESVVTSVTTQPMSVASITTVAAPQMSVASISVTSVAAPQVTVTSVAAPQVTITSVAAPQMSVAAPQVTVTSVAAPQMSVASVSTVEAPKMSVASVSVTSVAASQMSIARATTAASPQMCDANIASITTQRMAASSRVATRAQISVAPVHSAAAPAPQLCATRESPAQANDVGNNSPSAPQMTFIVSPEIDPKSGKVVLKVISTSPGAENVATVNSVLNLDNPQLLQSLSCTGIESSIDEGRVSSLPTSESPSGVSSMIAAPAQASTSTLSTITPVRSAAAYLPRRKIPESYVSPAFEKLKLPQAKAEPKKKVTLRAIMPKCLSGHEMIALMKQRKEDEEAAQKAKLERAEERARKRKLKEEEKIKKQEEREEKKRKREEEKKRKDEEKKRKQQEKQRKKEQGKGKGKGKGKSNRRIKIKVESEEEECNSNSDSDAVSDTIMSVHDDSDHDIGEDCRCYQCNELLVDEATGREQPVQCDVCPRWFHVKCMPEIIHQQMRELNLTIEEVDFECNFC